jgi:hypothetical protein
VKPVRLALLVLGCLASLPASAQTAQLREVERTSFPTATDGNTPSFWYKGRLRMFTSVGRPLQISEWDPENGRWNTQNVEVGSLVNQAIWVESAWVDDNDVVLGWYHHEPGGMYPDSNLTAPMIGALLSLDGGRTVTDLGFVLVSGDALDPQARNGAFTGGHGDFSVVLDRERRFFYFFFTNYGGADETQGIVAARLAYADRFAPAGRVFKYHAGAWNEPGVGGRVTPIFSATRAWQHADPDSYWGPAVHWNTTLNGFVMLLNRARGEPGWTQEGIYVSYATDLSRPEMWRTPERLMRSSELPNWGLFYPQVLGLETGGTDSVAGATARFFINGISTWEIDFAGGFPAAEAPADPLRIVPVNPALKLTK